MRVQARERTEWAHASISSAGASSPSGASSATAAGLSSEGGGLGSGSGLWSVSGVGGPALSGRGVPHHRPRLCQSERGCRVACVGPGCLKPVFGASRGGGAPAGVPQGGSRGGSSRGDRRHRCPPLRPACARGRLLLLGHEPREEVADLLADVAHRVVIGLVRGEGVVGRESPAVSCNITRRRRRRVGPKVLRSCGGRARSAMGMRSGCTRANARPLGSSSRQARAPRRKWAGWPRRLSRVAK